MRFIPICLGLVVCLVACCGCRQTKGPAAKAAAITIKGSDTMINLGQAWAETYRAVAPKTRVMVQGGGSGTGITALIEGNTDIAQTSRAFKDEEIAAAKAKGVTPQEIIVGWDGIAVVVHPKNPVQSLTTAQLSDIYTGKITDWQQVGGAPGPIVLLTREVNSGTYVFFKEHIVQRGDSKSPADYAKSALMLNSSQALYEEVANNPKAIGYLGLGYVKDKVRAVPVADAAQSKAIVPTVATVQDKSYPISRPLYYYTNGAPQGEVRAYIDFITGPDGQRVVSAQDFVPIVNGAK